MTDDAPTGPDEIAKRALELAARAEELARHAHETAGIDEQLAQLEAELGALDAEEAGLHAAGAEATANELTGPSTDWADQLTDRVGNLGDRIGVLVAQVTESAMHQVESALADRPDDAVEEHSVTAETTPRVDIDSGGGSVHVSAHPLNEVVVAARGRKPSDQDKLVDVTTTADGVRIVTRRFRHWRGRGVRLEVRVPMGSPLTVSTGGGRVVVEGVRGPASLRTGGGSIALTAARGAVSLVTGGGAIDATDLDGPLSARTGGGAISVAGRLSGACSVRTGGGNISLRLSEGTSLRVEGRGTGSASDVETLHANRGRITGYVGDGSGGELEVRTGGGSIRIER